MSLLIPQESANVVNIPFAMPWVLRECRVEWVRGKCVSLLTYWCLSYYIFSQFILYCFLIGEKAFSRDINVLQVC